MSRFSGAAGVDCTWKKFTFFFTPSFVRPMRYTPERFVQ
jgi:hypothetical protein